MNKLMIVIFDNEASANTGLQALHKLHAEGDISLYATGLLVKDLKGVVSIKREMASAPIGTAIGLAVGGLVGLLGGTVGMAVGAVAGTVVGAIHDFWLVGVGLDFIEEAEKNLQPGKVALVVELEEEWVTPLDSALEAAGGHIFRRARGEIAEAQFDHDIAAFKSEIAELESEVAHASGDAKTKLQSKLATTNISLDGAVFRAKQRVTILKQEADAKLESLKLQLHQANGDIKAKIENRMNHVKLTYRTRSAKLAQAWSMAKEALAA